MEGKKKKRNDLEAKGCGKLKVKGTIYEEKVRKGEEAINKKYKVMKTTTKQKSNTER